jgi:general secretion pathway protein D
MFRPTSWSDPAPLLPQGAQLIAHRSRNSLVISDRASNVHARGGIIARIDTVSDAEVEVIPLQHANAAEMARTLTLLADDKAAQAAGEAPRVLADERTNSILLAGARNGRLRMRALITHLDTPLKSGGDTNVVFLHYAKAKDLVPILQGVAATLSNEAQPTALKAGEAPTASANGAPTIQAHEETNALIISAAPAVFRSLEGVVRSLDVRRAQVLIEAVIAECPTRPRTNSASSGSCRSARGDHVIGGTNFSSGNSSAAATTSSAPRQPARRRQRLQPRLHQRHVTIGNTKIFQLGALVTALRSNGKNNVLSTPSVMTLDNKQAIIKVGQEVPFLTGAYRPRQAPRSRPATAARHRPASQSVPDDPAQGRRPHADRHARISTRAIRSSSRSPGGLVPRAAGSRRIRPGHEQARSADHRADQGRIRCSYRRPDLRHSSRTTRSRCRASARIPFFGNLFRYRSNDHQKQNLMVFLHPAYPCATPRARRRLSQREYNFISHQLLDAREHDDRHAAPRHADAAGRARFPRQPALDVAPKDRRRALSLDQEMNHEIRRSDREQMEHGEHGEEAETRRSKRDVGERPRINNRV